jgi:hypothetical protein
LVFGLSDLLLNEFVLHVHELLFLLLYNLTVFLDLDFLGSRGRFSVFVMVNALLEQVVTLDKFFLLILDGFAFLAQLLQLPNQVADFLLHFLFIF